nr:3-hydroxyacyl-CoA dehydrogenase NAD-binding domain-containing protein [Rhizobium sp. BK619]
MIKYQIHDLIRYQEEQGIHDVPSRPSFENSDINTVAIIGAGLIGCSWAALFAASGRRIHLFDSHTDAGQKFPAFWASVRTTLVDMGLLDPALEPDWHVFASAAEAVKEADFVQECIPERLDAKQMLYGEIEPALKAGTIVATSSSGLKLSDLQRGMQDPAHLIIAHPFNPPHIIPLVELYGNEYTAPGVLDAARELYEACGKKTITLNKEVMGHVANRLQAALWREAIALVADDVISVKDANTAVTAGPGMRWAVMGPHMLLNLGGGEGGLRAYCQQFRDSYDLWWADLGKPRLDDATIEKLMGGLQEEIEGRDYAALREERDRKLVGVLRAVG